MNVQEAYSTLETDYGSSLDAIEKSYRNLIRVWHPDRFTKSPDLHAFAEEKSKRLNHARDVLRAAWSTGKLIDDAGPEVRSETPTDGYEDHLARYLGDDPRIRSRTYLELSGRESAIALTKHGIILATMAKSDVDEVMYYPTAAIQCVLNSKEMFLRPDCTACRVTDLLPTDVMIIADDPEQLVRNHLVKLRFRNEYFAKLFIKRTVSMLGLQEAPPIPEVSFPQEGFFLVAVIIIGVLILGAALQFSGQ